MITNEPTQILCTSGRRSVVATLEVAKTWNAVCGQARSDSPNYHAVGAYMAVRSLLSSPQTLSTLTSKFRARSRAKVERGYELEYSMLNDGDILLKSLNVDPDGEALKQSNLKQYCFKVESKKANKTTGRPMWRAKRISTSNIVIKPSSVNHILIADSKLEDNLDAATYGSLAINQGHSDHTVSTGDTFYMFHFPAKKSWTGYTRIASGGHEENSLGAFEAEIASVISSAARVCAQEYKQRAKDGQKATAGLKSAELKKADFGNISASNRQSSIQDASGSRKDKAASIGMEVNSKQGIPDPVVCWTGNGDGDKVFRNAVNYISKQADMSDVYKASSTPEFHGHKLQQLYLNNCTVDVNNLDKEMEKLGIEWSAKKFSRSQVSLKNKLVDGYFSSEYKLLKRRMEVEQDEVKRRSMHAGFVAEGQLDKKSILKAAAPTFSSHGAVGAGLKAAGTTAAGVFAATKTVAAGDIGTQMNALSDKANSIAAKAAMTLDPNAGIVSKAIDTVELAMQHGSTTALYAGATYLSIKLIEKYRNDSYHKAKFLFDAMNNPDIHSMPSDMAKTAEKAKNFRKNNAARR